MSALRSHTGQRFRTEVAGLRGFAILVVVLFHAGVILFRGGFIGVDIFFVLSGFVLTRALDEERKSTGRIRLAEFYARRSRRLVPMSTLVIAVTVLFGSFIVPPNQLHDLLHAGASASLYAGNLFFAASDLGRIPPEFGTNSLVHLWSLGVEWQFYLILPITMILPVLRKHQRAFSAMTLGVIAGSLAFAAAVGPSAPSTTYFTLLGRGFAPAFGVLLALWIDRIELQVSLRWRSAGSVIGFVVLCASAALFSRASSWPTLFAIIPVVATGLVILGGERGAGRLLSSWPMQQLGRISYGLYLVHWPLLVLVPLILRHDLGLLGKLTLLLIAAFVAAVLAQTFENPLRRSRFLAAHARRGIALAVCGTLIGLLAVAGAEAIQNAR
jgi:peptidoglycan/LPS O-acetylase OafA/YrhL